MGHGGAVKPLRSRATSCLFMCQTAASPEPEFAFTVLAGQNADAFRCASEIIKPHN